MSSQDEIQAVSPVTVEEEEKADESVQVTVDVEEKADEVLVEASAPAAELLEEEEKGVVQAEKGIVEEEKPSADSPRED